jgi:hypothetical protein
MSAMANTCLAPLSLSKAATLNRCGMTPSGSVLRARSMARRIARLHTAVSLATDTPQTPRLMNTGLGAMDLGSVIFTLCDSGRAAAAPAAAPRLRAVTPSAMSAATETDFANCTGPPSGIDKYRFPNSSKSGLPPSRDTTRVQSPASMVSRQQLASCQQAER